MDIPYYYIKYRAFILFVVEHVLNMIKGKESELNGPLIVKMSSRENAKFI